MTLNILAFFAHPDDETMFMGGALALLARQGAHVHYVCATRGEGGETGEPPICTLEELGDVREQELVCAVGALRGRSLTFLGHVDPRVGPDDELYPFTDNLTHLAGQIAASIKQFDIHVVLTHGSNGEYGHPAHVLCHQAAVAAVLSFPEETRPVLYTASASFLDHPYPRLTNANDPAHLILDLTPVLNKKTGAALCHRTQHALFVRRRSEQEGRQLTVPEIILPVEGVHRLLPAWMGEPDDPVAEMLVQAGARMSEV
ncbi:MAG TPA: PIG-L deacetylase family protein [Anaerolineales bacterium]|nr:PIG-L deacetylase family protein [Anaerolineales bacterium]